MSSPRPSGPKAGTGGGPATGGPQGPMTSSACSTGVGPITVDAPVVGSTIASTPSITT